MLKLKCFQYLSIVLSSSLLLQILFLFIVLLFFVFISNFGSLWKVINQRAKKEICYATQYCELNDTLSLNKNKCGENTLGKALQFYSMRFQNHHSSPQVSKYRRMHLHEDFSCLALFVRKLLQNMNQRILFSFLETWNFLRISIIFRIYLMNEITKHRYILIY